MSATICMFSFCSCNLGGNILQHHASSVFPSAYVSIFSCRIWLPNWLGMIRTMKKISFLPLMVVLLQVWVKLDNNWSSVSIVVADDSGSNLTCASCMAQWLSGLCITNWLPLRGCCEVHIGTRLFTFSLLFPLTHKSPVSPLPLQVAIWFLNGTLGMNVTVLLSVGFSSKRRKPSRYIGS